MLYLVNGNFALCANGVANRQGFFALHLALAELLLRNTSFTMSPRGGKQRLEFSFVTIVTLFLGACGDWGFGQVWLALSVFTLLMHRSHHIVFPARPFFRLRGLTRKSAATKCMGRA